MGQLNIKDEKLIGSIRRLAARKGTSATEALRIAVEGELSRDAAEREAVRQARYDAIMAIAARSAERLRGVPESELDHGRLLYDPETGLPR